MTDNLKIDLQLTVDGASRQVDIDKVAVNAEWAANIDKEQLEAMLKKACAHPVATGLANLDKTFRENIQAQTGTKAELAKLVALGQTQAAELATQTALLQAALPLLDGKTLLALARSGGGSPQQVQVVVENRGSTQQEVVEQRAALDGERLVVNVALDDIARRGPLSQGLEQAYGLGRRTG